MYFDLLNVFFQMHFVYLIFFSFQINSATAWIDGSVIYGKTKSHTEVLRAFKNGLLKNDIADHSFPVSNEGYLSLFSPSKNFQDNKIEKPKFSMYILYVYFTKTS